MKRHMFACRRTNDGEIGPAVPRGSVVLGESEIVYSIYTALYVY